MTLKHFRFSTIWVFRPFCLFYVNFADIAKDPIIWKIIWFGQIPKPLEDSIYMSSIVDMVCYILHSKILSCFKEHLLVHVEKIFYFIIWFHELLKHLVPVWLFKICDIDHVGSILLFPTSVEETNFEFSIYICNFQIIVENVGNSMLYFLFTVLQSNLC